MTYKILTQIHHEDVGENSPALQQMEIRLRAAIDQLAQLNAVGPARPGSVGQLRGMFGNRAQASELEQTIAMLRRQVTQLGGTADATGRVTQRRGRDLVLYDHDAEERGLTRAEIIGGRLYYFRKQARGGRREAVDTTGMRNDYATAYGYGIYVLSANGNFHVSDQEVGRRHHSSLLAGMPVAGAGEIRVVNGTITGITNRSGHYCPSIDHFLQVIHHLEKRQANLDSRATITFLGGAAPAEFNPPNSVGNFLRANHLDDESYEWNNLLYAYRALLLDAALLASKGWEYRPAGAHRTGVYMVGTNNMADLHTVRVFLKGRGTPYTQPTADAHFAPANPARPADRPRSP